MRAPVPFSFDYSIPFLRWALQSPDQYAEWLVGIRVKQTRKLVAFISATPGNLIVHSKSVKLPEINFLCVHKKLRSKRLAPILIKEITRRINVDAFITGTSIQGAIYTTGIRLPLPVAQCWYWHRALNTKKLIETGFYPLTPRMTMSRTIKLYALPEETRTRGLRPIRESDHETCCEQLNAFLKTFLIAPQLSVAEFRHWMGGRPDVIYTYVVEDPDTLNITDMVSFYSLPSTVLSSSKHGTLYAANCFYYFNAKTPLNALMHDALILAKRHNFDVFTTLDFLHNETFIKDLKFVTGEDGALRYHLFNWRSPFVKPEEVGLILL